MLNRLISLTEGDLHRIVREVLNEDKLGLLEYHAQQRLPFDDDFYGKKNQAEHYLDWLEEFGKYGKIGNSSLALQDCVKSGVKMAIEKDRIDSFASIDNIVNELMGKFKHITFDNRNNIYVERAIKISDSIDSVAIDLFSSLTDKYENNVGGCWAFKSGMGYAYCSSDSGSELLLKGWIRLEDVDWLKTCDLNYNQDEFEIRVKPNAKVELFEVIADGKYKLPLHDTLVVSSTYFGNGQGYKGDIATVDDGMGHVTLINRKGEYLNPDLWFNEIDDFYNGFARVFIRGKGWNFISQDGTLLSLDNGEDIRDIVDYVGYFSEGFARVRFQDMWNFITQDGTLLSQQWFDEVDDFYNGFARVKMEDIGWNFLKQDGSLLSPNQWFYYDYVGYFEDGIARVRLEDKGWNFIKPDGSLLSPNKWFEYDDVDDFYEGFARVCIYDKGYNFIRQDGSLLSPNQWFNRAWYFENGFAKVGIGDKVSNSLKLNNERYNFLKLDGTYLSPNQWFDEIDEFENGFAKVEIKGEYNLLKLDGSLLSPNKWFYYVGEFKNGFAKVVSSFGKVYDISQDGRLYDLDGNLVESRKLRNSYLHRVLNESIKKVLKGNIYRR